MIYLGKRAHRLSTFLPVAVLLLAHVSFAQTPVTPGIDAPALLLGYFSLHLAIDQQAAVDSSLRHSAANMMGITDADFALISRVARSLMTDMRNIRSEEAAAPRGAATAATARDIAQRFKVRREAALTSALRAMQNQMSAQSWNALRDYINGRYRNSVHSQAVTAN
jgi:hypothetical protein